MSFPGRKDFSDWISELVKKVLTEAIIKNKWLFALKRAITTEDLVKQ